MFLVELTACLRVKIINLPTHQLLFYNFAEYLKS